MKSNISLGVWYGFEKQNRRMSWGLIDDPNADPNWDKILVRGKHPDYCTIDPCITIDLQLEVRHD